ncbi:MAG: CBS domain-containing protein [Pseudomonadota bacterium]|nr:CBS domain-containing protein [Pseudomonadota bacterium]
MSIGEYCNREVIVTDQHTSVPDAACLMRDSHVGDLIVVEQAGEEHLPIGILTDRDLVVEVLAQRVAPDTLLVEDVMTPNPATARENEDMLEALSRMRRLGVRRMPVVNERGGLVGILTADDVLELLNEGLTDLVNLVNREIGHERARRQI